MIVEPLQPAPRYYGVVMRLDTTCMPTLDDAFWSMDERGVRSRAQRVRGDDVCALLVYKDAVPDIELVVEQDDAGRKITIVSSPLPDVSLFSNAPARACKVRIYTKRGGV